MFLHYVYEFSDMFESERHPDKEVCSPGAGTLMLRACKSESPRLKKKGSFLSY